VIRLCGAGSVWRTVGQHLLNDGCQHRTGRGTCFCVARPPPNIGQHRKGFDARLTAAGRISVKAHPKGDLPDR
jgi:hypothetical protein